ncbi:MAG TPA: glutaredoxin family protein [Roseateles sp.]|nr:glutaredoxin family protein [Roseateles sp.]
MSKIAARELLVLLGLVALSWGASQWIGGRQAEQQGQALRELARPGDIVMLSSVGCVFCKRASAWLVEQKVTHRECFIERDAACMAEYQARGARGTPTFVVRGRTLLGFDPERIRAILRPPA